jgi:hypothetical protein
MADSSYPWIQAYQHAVEETDPDKLNERVLAAATAIYTTDAKNLLVRPIIMRNPQHLNRRVIC